MSRSPKYPAFSLPQALAVADRVYAAINLSSVDTNIFFEAMGYNGRTGTSSRALASLKYYGFIKGRASDVQLSELYQRIAMAFDVTEKNNALIEAAHSPEIFKKMFEEHNPLPPANILESIAIRKFAFSSVGAKKFVSKLVETDSFIKNLGVSEASKSAEIPMENNDMGELKGAEGELPFKEAERDSSQTVGEILKFKLTKELEAEVRFIGELNADGIQRLIRHLEFTSEIYE